ncbi:FkbM family methyltransferase [Nonlabens marinus]|uniref:FkbM family methyltransferase n=1 Tax=Nonlabens marinus TaxID=930802 RepID=UPI00130EE042|nr:FkbM family methyltransferase [Nonlabens marinus]
MKEVIYRRYDITFSRTGDDIQLLKLVNFAQPGTYVDVGCWHPIKASNTYRFYARGWKGICIDANPLIKTTFNKYRPNDNFVNCLIGSESSVDMEYFLLEEEFSSMNTLDYQFLLDHGIQDKIKTILKLPVLSLKSVLDQHLTTSDKLAFFDVDVEGYDLEVLKSNDWLKYRPKVVMVESNLNIEEDLKSEVYSFMKSVGYRYIAKSVVNRSLENTFFIDDN